MADATDPRDTTIPNQAANTEKAEGSRENANESTGITKRPIDQEQKEQQSLPPRGKSKDGAHA